MAQGDVRLVTAVSARSSLHRYVYTKSVEIGENSSCYGVYTNF
jgi:hypothetical protein